MSKILCTSRRTYESSLTRISLHLRVQHPAHSGNSILTSQTCPIYWPETMYGSGRLGPNTCASTPDFLKIHASDSRPEIYIALSHRSTRTWDGQAQWRGGVITSTPAYPGFSCPERTPTPRIPSHRSRKTNAGDITAAPALPIGRLSFPGAGYIERPITTRSTYGPASLIGRPPAGGRGNSLASQHPAYHPNAPPRATWEMLVRIAVSRTRGTHASDGDRTFSTHQPYGGGVAAGSA